MSQKKNILVIIGSASSNSVNQKLVDGITILTKDYFNLNIYGDLKILPHFDPEQSINNPPPIISKLRQDVERADGVLISTPEYIFSIPSGLKNALEWCVATTVFTEKPTGIITASAQGKRGHEELKMIFETLMAVVTDETMLLIQGVKGKIDAEGTLSDEKTRREIGIFVNAFKKLVAGNSL